MAIDGSTAEGVFKEVYGELENTVPDFAIVAQDIPFQQRARIGEKYEFPVRLRRGHGVTLKSGSGSLEAFQLNAVVSGQTKPASVDGSSYVARESFAYKAVAAAPANGRQAFVDVFNDGVEDLFNTAGFYLEALLIYGQTSFGAFEDAGAASASQTLNLTAASSAPGLWAQMEGAYVDVYSDTNFGTKRNAAGTLRVTGVDFDPDNGKVALTIAASDTAEADAIAAGDVVVPRGFYDSAHMTMAGLDKILTNTGTLFGISASTYPGWKASTYDVGTAQATFSKVIKAAVAIAVRCPPMREALKCYVSPMTWTDLNNNVAALRKFTESTKGGADFGTGKITYYSNVGSAIELVSHPMVKGGEFFMGFASTAVRGGVSEPSFDVNKDTGQNPRFLRELADHAGFEVRIFWDQFLIIRRPRAWVKGTGIVNSN